MPREYRLTKDCFRPELVEDFQSVLGFTGSGKKTIIDARPADRFFGRAPEPRAGLASGHIPTSLNVPVGSLSVDGHMRPANELNAIFEGAGR